MDEELEEELLAVIADEFPDYRIENPTDHVENYYDWRDNRDGVTGMDYYFEEVLPGVDAGVFLPFEDDRYGAGTAAEIGFLLYQETDVYEISHEGEIEPLLDVLTVEETMERLYDR